MSRMRHVLLLAVCCLSLFIAGTTALADSPENLAIDSVRVVPGCQIPVYELPERGAGAVSRDTSAEYLVGGIMTNAQGRWYEVIFPVKGWMRESDAKFTNSEGRYNPGLRSEEERILLRLKVDIGTGPEMWRRTLGMPWYGESWKEQRGGREVTISTAIWPGAAIAVERQKEGESGTIIKASLCGKIPAGFGPYALGAPGRVLRRLDKNFRPSSYAKLHSGKFSFVLDEDEAISFLAYSADGRDFLSCSGIGAPDPDILFSPSFLYPQSWCPGKTLKVGLACEGGYTGFGCDEDCTAGVRLDSGEERALVCTEEDAARWFGTRSGSRVRAVYNVEQYWDAGQSVCAQRFVLQRGRLLAGEGEVISPSRNDCRRLTVASGDAQGVVTRIGEGSAGSVGDWEILLDSERPLSFHAGRGFPGKDVTLREGMRIALHFERLQSWDAKETICGLETFATGPVRIIRQH